MGAVSADVHEIAAARLRQVAQRYTSARRAVVDVLVAADRPLTIPEVLARRPGLAQSSAYRNLAVLEQAGVVHRIVTSDEYGRYELAEEVGQHHHHLICSRCGGVSDFIVAEDVEHDLDRALASAARRHGFAIDHHRLDLIGTCPDCR